ncbi:hypothetical protein ACQPU1_13740 [Clostridium paraputrificum]|uniref:hypothetical protein n=1 Tax=Clostridium TaxID=1485 RepID=UPI003D3500B6
MSKCPFWSTTKSKVECYSECPMNRMDLKEDNCPFKEYLSESKIKFKDIVSEDFAYSQDKVFELEFAEETSNF